MKLVDCRKILLLLVKLIGIFFLIIKPSYSVPAFPGAEGFGANSVGGRGGQVIEVTNLNDSGPGSLRAALEAKGPRIVIFRVGGTIELLSRIRIEHPYITIAGQTAPGGGITIKNHPSNIRSPIDIRTHDVIMRYIRSRPGPSAQPSDTVDALAISAGHNIIIDHCSFSWATDEVVNTWNDVRDVTIQWSIIAEGLNNSTHPKGAHSKGMLLGSEGAERISIHHNLFAHNWKRTPDVNLSGIVDIVNNVIYNFRRAIIVKDEYAKPKVNYIGNYAKRGSAGFYNYEIEYWTKQDSSPEAKQDFSPEIYVQDNIGFSRSSSDLPEHLVVREEDRQYIIDARHEAAPITTLSASDAYSQVLENAGATFPMRDAVDQRIVNDVIKETGKIIDDPAEVGGWPELISGKSPTDTDHDGMPDDWEDQQGLNKNDPSDSRTDADGDGYTNLEEYLNEIIR